MRFRSDRWVAVLVALFVGGGTVRVSLGASPGALAVGSGSAATLPAPISGARHDGRRPAIEFPDIVVTGPVIALESVLDYQDEGALTTHVFALTEAPGGTGSVEVVVDGDYGDDIEVAAVSAEGLVLGTVGGTNEDCTPKTGAFALDTAQMADLAADGTATILVQNGSEVGSFCDVNRHTVRLRYEGRADPLSFGSILAGASPTRTLVIHNAGAATLHVTSITSTVAEFTVSPEALEIAPGGSAPVTVTFWPHAPGTFEGVLTIASDDPDQPLWHGVVRGDAGPAPFTVSPYELDVTVPHASTAVRSLSLGNDTADTLAWTAGPGIASSLEQVLVSLDAGSSSITSIIPGRYDFPGGEAGSAIDDGRGLLYNMLSTPGGSIPYSDGTIVASPAFGATGRYFTRKYTGLFVLAADLATVTPFQTAGTFRVFQVDNPVGAVLERTTGGVLYRGFVKRGGDIGAVNHLIIVQAGPGQSQTFPPISYQDTHTVFIPGARRLYYLMYRAGGLDDAATQRIFDAFMDLVGPEWLSAAPLSGSLPGGESAEIQVRLDANGLAGGSYSAPLPIQSSSPIAHQVAVPVRLTVPSAPDIAIVGDPVVVSSAQPLTSTTIHHLRIDTAPVGGGSLDVVTNALFSNYQGDITVRADAAVLGVIPAVQQQACLERTGTFALTPEQMADLSRDGTVDVVVQNGINVSPACGFNQQLVRLSYATPVTGLDFGSVILGTQQTASIQVKNLGDADLHVSSITTGSPDVVPSQASLTVPPGGSSALTVTYAPSAAAPLAAELHLASDDPDEADTTLSLRGEGLVPPDIDVSPRSFEESAFTGASISEGLTIRNTGGSDLAWRIDGAARDLEGVLGALDGDFAKITSVIPNRYDFSDGETGTVIHGGGAQMYMTGNSLRTDLGGEIPYSNGVIASSLFLGPGGRYFTRKYPGLFVLAAEVRGVASFSIHGYIGAYGPGSLANATVLQRTVGGVTYNGFVRRLWGSDGPSINHIVIVPALPGQHQDVATDAFDEGQTVTLAGATRVFELLYAGTGGAFIDDAATGAIFDAFLGRVGPGWVSAAPPSGVVPAGDSAPVKITLDATALAGGDYARTFTVASNDPDESGVSIDARLHVIDAPDIAPLEAEMTVTSVQDFTTPNGAVTTHDLPVPVLPLEGGSLQATVEGDFGNPWQTATVRAENTFLGSVGGGGQHCGAVERAFPLTAQVLATLAQDGVVHAEVTNDYSVGASCAVNRHTVRLDYRAPVAALDFGAVTVGLDRVRSLFVRNVGVQPLQLLAVSTDRSEIAVTSALPPPIPPGATETIVLRFTPTTGGHVAGALTIASNDPDEPVTSLPLAGDGALGPRISVAPSSFDETLPAGTTVQRALTIRNDGDADLHWALRAKPASLEDVLGALDAGYGVVNSQIPDRYDFTEGVTGTSIATGGGGMYQGGNVLSCGSASSIPYSDGTILPLPELGKNGRYFTRKYPGLFVFAADLDPLNQFSVGGFLGTDGSGFGGVDGAVLERSAGGVVYRAFVKRVWDGGVPSVNHIVIVESGDGQSQQYFPLEPQVDFQVVTTGRATRVYYLLYSGDHGSYIDDKATDRILASFLALAAAGWAAPVSGAGTLTPGAVADVPIDFGAGLPGGDYHAELAITSDDPFAPEVRVPARLHVSGAPHLRLAGVRTSVESLLPFRDFNDVVTHVLPLPAPASGPGKIDLTMKGYFFTSSMVSVDAEGIPLGTLPTSDENSCQIKTGLFDLSSEQMAAIAADGVASITVTVNSVGNLCGGYQRLRLTYDGPVDPLDFGRLFVSQSRSLAIEVRNEGTAPLHVTSIASDLGVFAADATSLTVAPYTSARLTVTFTPSGPGSFEGALTLRSDDPDAPAVTVHLRGAAVRPPNLVAAPDRFDEALFTGQSVTRTLTLANDGGTDLDWSLDAGQGLPLGVVPGWLSASPTSGTLAPGASVPVAVRLDATALQGATYVGRLRISSNDLDEPVRSLPVTLDVTGAPDIALEGRAFTVESIQDYETAGVTTVHALAAPVPPGAGGTLSVIARGAYYDPTATTTVTAEGEPVGAVTWEQGGCGSIPVDFPLSPGRLRALTADGIVSVTLASSSEVYPQCPENDHVVRLSYRGALDPLDFGAIDPGSSLELSITVENHGVLPLTVSRLVSNLPDFATTVGSLSVPPGEERPLAVLFTPHAEGDFEGTLTLENDDPDEPAVSIHLRGHAHPAPRIAVSPPSIEATAPLGGSASRVLGVSNAGGRDLHVTATTESAATLEEVLAALDAGYESVTSTIPDRFDFEGGEAGDSILDGGQDMYDNGNQLATDRGYFIPYSDGVVATSPWLGPAGRYVTRKHPGLFVFAADLDGVRQFLLYGAIGAASQGLLDGTVLHRTAGGVSCTALVKRTFAGAGPSVNHLVIVEDAPASQEFLPGTYADQQRVYLPGAKRMYYLLYAGSQGTYIDDAATGAVLDAFLRLLHPAWLSASPAAQVVGPSGSSGVNVVMDAEGLLPGAHRARIVLASNDPDRPRTEVLVTLRACRPGHGEDCDDGDACTEDACDAAAGCTHAIASCDDANPCTDDACDRSSGCVHAPNHAPCNDGDACTRGDACAEGTCVGGRPVIPKIDCNDHNACTQDTCDPDFGCMHTPVLCNDHDRNTIDTCDRQRGCVFTPRSPGPSQGPALIGDSPE